MTDTFATDDMTPEKLTVMKLKASGLGRDIMSEPLLLVWNTGKRSQFGINDTPVNSPAQLIQPPRK